MSLIYIDLHLLAVVRKGIHQSVRVLANDGPLFP
jgi:hypothetical protein